MAYAATLPTPSEPGIIVASRGGEYRYKLNTRRVYGKRGRDYELTGEVTLYTLWSPAASVGEGFAGASLQDAIEKACRRAEELELESRAA